MNLFSRLGTAVKYAATGRLSSSVLVGGFEGAMMHRRLIGWKATQESRQCCRRGDQAVEPRAGYRVEG